MRRVLLGPIIQRTFSLVTHSGFPCSASSGHVPVLRREAPSSTICCFTLPQAARALPVCRLQTKDWDNDPHNQSPQRGCTQQPTHWTVSQFVSTHRKAEPSSICWHARCSSGRLCQLDSFYVDEKRIQRNLRFTFEKRCRGDGSLFRVENISFTDRQCRLAVCAAQVVVGLRWSPR